MLVSGADFGQIRVWKKTEGEFNENTVKSVLEMKHGPGTARLLVIGSDLYSGSGTLPLCLTIADPMIRISGLHDLMSESISVV